MKYSRKLLNAVALLGLTCYLPNSYADQVACSTGYPSSSSCTTSRIAANQNHAIGIQLSARNTAKCKAHIWDKTTGARFGHVSATEGHIGSDIKRGLYGRNYVGVVTRTNSNGYCSVILYSGS